MNKYLNFGYITLHDGWGGKMAVNTRVIMRIEEHEPNEWTKDAISKIIYIDNHWIYAKESKWEIEKMLL